MTWQTFRVTDIQRSLLRASLNPDSCHTNEMRPVTVSIVFFIAHRPCKLHFISCPYCLSGMVMSRFIAVFGPRYMLLSVMVYGAAGTCVVQA